MALEHTEANLRTRLKVLESCQSLLNYIQGVLRSDDGYLTEEVVKSFSPISSEIYKQKLIVWEDLGMLAPVSPGVRKLLESKLRGYVDEDRVHKDLLSGNRWMKTYTDPVELREHLKELLDGSLNIRREDTDQITIAVPKRNIEPNI